MNRRQSHKGRASLSNPAGRFERYEVEPFDDGWDSPPEDGDEPRRPPTEVTAEPCKTILSHNDSPDVPFDRSINPYKGCEHGCIYCFARPSHGYLGMSSGLDFETRIVSKPNAAEVLRATFARASYRPEPLALGANTDPYQPIERRLGITRALLEVLAEHRHPVGIVTKSAGVLRDVDLLAPMAEQRLAHVFVSITTLDPELARRMEPRASSPRRRIEAIRRLSQEGIPVGVLASPIIPALNDSELERILEAAAEAGAVRAGTILIRLPHEVKDLFGEWLAHHYPERAGRVLARIREARGGKLYDSTFGDRMRGHGLYADMLRRRFELAARRLGLSRERFDYDVSQFRRPELAAKQLRLF